MNAALPLLIWLAGAAALGLDAPWWIRGALSLPAVLWAPGWGWAGLARGDGLQRSLDAAWIGIALATLDVALIHALGLHVSGAAAPALMGLSLLWTLGGLAVTRGRPAPQPPALGALAGAAFVLICVAASGWQHRASLSRTLDIYWYPPSAALETERPAQPWRAVDGWGAVERLGWEEAGAGRLEDPEGDGGGLELAEGGWIQIALRGPVGAELRLIAGDEVLAERAILRDVIEDPEEGPVPRYLERGVAAVAVEAPAGALEVQVAGADGPTQIYVTPGTEAVWALDESGALRFVHYYQILNLVENQRWAEEVLTERWVTIHQPPLWSYVLATSSALVSPDMPGAAALFLWVGALVGVSGVRLLALAAPRAPATAWALPGLYAAIHAKLMIIPGSVNFPDSLYAAAMVGGLAALVQAADGRGIGQGLIGRGAPRFAALGLAAGLLRYPGTIALTLAAGVYAAAWRRLPWRPIALLWGVVVAAAAGFGIAALASDALRDWLFILWFETVPEHYDNNPEAPPLLARPPEFYGLWLRYTGLGLLLVLPMATRGARLIAGWALVYSLLLCTIDHFPTHYFLPLLALTAAGVGANAAGMRSRAAREGLPLAAIAGALYFISQGAP